MQRYPLVLVGGFAQELPDGDRVIHSANVVRSATPPGTPVEGDLWLNTINSTLQVYDGTAFVSIFASGDAVTAGDGIDVNANVVSVDLKVGGGLAIEATELALDLGAGSITGTLGSGDGGTGQTSYTNGELLIGNSATSGLSKRTLTAGSNISITNGNGTIEIAATQNPVTAGDGIDVSTAGGTDQISVDLKAGGGLVIEATELAVDLGAGSITGTLSTADGGTGQTSYTDGQLLIGNTATGGLTKAVLTAGSNISITNGNGSIQVSASTVPLIDGGNFTNGTSIVATTNTFDGGSFT
jgi:hypothetical protein